MTVSSLKRRLAAATRRRRIVTVIGSGQIADSRCAEVGCLIATLGFDLLTGAGLGVMVEVSRAFFEVSPRRGLVIGIVPATVEPLEALESRQPHRIDYTPPPGYPNEWVELAIFTHLPASGRDGTLRSSRNHINVLSADAIVALPGREGTTSEMWLATQYGVPIVTYGDHEEPVPHGILRAASLEALGEFLTRHAG